MPHDDKGRPDDEATDSAEAEPKGERSKGHRTGEAQAAANREGDPPA